MPLIRGINVSTLAECSESDSAELNAIIETEELVLDDLAEKVIRSKRRILSAELKLR